MKKVSMTLVVALLSLTFLSCSGGGGSTGISGATAPDAPSNVTATSGDGQVTLSWGAASRATSYTVYWKNSPGVTKSDSAITGATSPYVHSSLTNGTAYYYAVSASNAIGESGLSAEVSATPEVVIAGVPANITVMAGNGQNILSWDAVANAQSYTVYWSYAPGVTTSSNKITNATSPYTHQSLYNGTSYYYAVTATSTSGIESGLSAEVSATPKATPPAIPFVTNGEVLSIAVASSGTTYLGGNFTKIGPATGSAVPLDATSGSPVSVYPRVSGEVYAVAPDGSGGWYIGGLFTHVGGITRNNIAHILPDGSVDPSWNPNASGTVLALAVNGSAVYSGGSFTSIGGQSRNNIAALDAAGAATVWNPGADNTVFALALNAGNSTLYAGGDFTVISGQTRTAIAALDTTTGSANSWDAQAGPLSAVYALALDGTGSTLYVGGDFTTIGSEPTRNYVAALNTSGTGTATSWAPEADNIVWALALNGAGDTVYAGGDFVTVGTGTASSNRNHIAAFDMAGNATSWNPNANATVLTLVASGTTIYAGGDFTSIGGASRSNIAALSSTSGTATSWNPDANSTVWTLGVYGSTVFAGGSFTSVGSQTRNHVASFDVAGNLTSWNPNANNPVSALTVSANTVYAGGNFTNIGGQPRNNIAALNSWGTGTSTGWNPSADGAVDALAVSGSTVYAGGEFTYMQSQPRNYLAAIDTGTGSVGSWDPDADGFVYALAISGDGSIVYAGGDFTNLHSNSTPTLRSHLAAIDASGTITSWNPNVDAGNSVYALATSGTSSLYVGGDFSSIGGISRKNIALLDTVSGTVDPSWIPDADFPVFALAVTLNSSTIYAGGEFTAIGGAARKNIAALDASGHTVALWNPNPNSWVNTIAISGSMVYAGGNFTSVGIDPLSYFARISQ